VYDFFRGVVAEKGPGHVVLDVAGVGYRLEVPGSTYERVREAGGGVVKLLAYLHVREDDLRLYGFATEGERRLFGHLLTIKGIGPTIALNILSGSSIPDIVRAIKDGDARFLDRIRGVGKKTADRVVLELREKADAILSSLAQAPLGLRSGAAPAASAISDDAARALMSLGFQAPIARRAVDAALATIEPKNPPIEALIKEALRHTS
jgi:Holliday junction DNA helicase RuvA